MKKNTQVNFKLYKIEVKMIEEIKEATGYNQTTAVFREGLRMMYKNYVIKE